MTTYSIRCRNSTCRHRRTSTKHPDDYKVVPKCSACGARKGWRIEQRQYARRDRCYCSGYHHPHQKGTSQFCEHHPDGVRNQALRQGATPDDLPIEYMGRTMKETDDCPF